MAVTVETLDKLERKITLTLSADVIKNEVESRLKRLARTVKADGFRPGKVPMSIVAQRYGFSVQYEVMNDKVGEAFAKAANEAQLKVAGAPRITEKEGAPEGELAFDATFEVYPDVKIGDLAGTEVERVSTEVTEAAIDKTVDILRKQRRTFHQRPAAEAAADGDRVTIDFEGKIDGVPFEGGKAEGFQFLLGEGRIPGGARPVRGRGLLAHRLERARQGLDQLTDRLLATRQGRASLLLGALEPFLREVEELLLAGAQRLRAERAELAAEAVRLGLGGSASATGAERVAADGAHEEEQQAQQHGVHVSHCPTGVRHRRSAG